MTKEIIITNADNEQVKINSLKDWNETISIAGVETVEIYYSKGGWQYLEPIIQQWVGVKDICDGDISDYYHFLINGEF